MAGYFNYSMSNNAVAAYMSGEMPISRWKKTDIIGALVAAGVNDEKIAIVKAASAKSCKKLLRRVAWHHTSVYYNETDFYSVDTEYVEEANSDELQELLKDEPKQEEKEVKAVCQFLVWTGSRKHPKATECVESGVIRGKWFYLSDGSKKSINANGFHVLEKL